MCSFLMFQRRTEIFSQSRYSPRAGIPLLSLAILLGVVAIYSHQGEQQAAGLDNRPHFRMDGGVRSMLWRRELSSSRLPFVLFVSHDPAPSFMDGLDRRWSPTRIRDSQL